MRFDPRSFVSNFYDEKVSIEDLLLIGDVNKISRYYHSMDELVSIRRSTFRMCTLRARAMENGRSPSPMGAYPVPCMIMYLSFSRLRLILPRLDAAQKHEGCQDAKYLPSQ